MSCWSLRPGLSDLTRQKGLCPIRTNKTFSGPQLVHKGLREAEVHRHSHIQSSRRVWESFLSEPVSLWAGIPAGQPQAGGPARSFSRVPSAASGPGSPVSGPWAAPAGERSSLQRRRRAPWLWLRQMCVDLCRLISWSHLHINDDH